MPARGRALRGFGDEHLTQKIPRLAAERALVPDANGTLAHPRDLRPLDFEMTVREDVHRAWSHSPNTGFGTPPASVGGMPMDVSASRTISGSISSS